VPEKQKPEGDGPATIARRAVSEVALGVLGRFETLLAVLGMAFASVFLMVGWQFGPLVMLEAQQYKKLTGHVDARIVESWLALEFDASSVRVPSNWRASTNAAGCVVAEYGGDWGAPLRRAFCGTRVPLNDSYMLADLRDISPGVPFAWARDEHGFVVPEIRIAPSTRHWLASHAPDKFMHQQWPADTALDWLRLELDLPVDDAIYGWTAPPPILPLSFDPARPAEALPTGIVKKRLDQGPNWIAMAMGFGVGLFVWFKAIALMPLIQGMASVGRWIVSALPLLTLPWWMDALPQTFSHFSRGVAGVLGDMFADINRTDRLVASEPEQATLANGERLVWRFNDSVYADTMGIFHFVAPNPPPASEKAALAALTETITVQARALDDAKRAELFTTLMREKQAGLSDAGRVFLPAAKEVAADSAASAATRRSAQRFIDYY
jgi:hypothetical protein